METSEEINSTTVRNSSMLPPATNSSNLNVGRRERIISVLAGTVLSTAGIRRIGRPDGLIMTLAGGYLLTRGITGFCFMNKLTRRDTAHRKVPALEITNTFTINKPRKEVYTFWRKLENLPRFMKHLAEVRETTEKRSVWKTRIPGGISTISWEAEIVQDDADNYLSWTSLPGSAVDNAGEVRFMDAPGDRGTEVWAHISYRMPAGDVGKIVGKLFNPVVEQLVREDLRRFKSLLETGESPTIEGQPSARMKDIQKANSKPVTPKQKENYESAMLEWH